MQNRNNDLKPDRKQGLQERLPACQQLESAPRSLVDLTETEIETDESLPLRQKMHLAWLVTGLWLVLLLVS